MANAYKDVTKAELAVLKNLWKRKSATMKELAYLLYDDGASSDIATVQKLISRLEKKGYVFRNNKVWPQQFHAAIAREDLIMQRLQATAVELCDGTMPTLLTHLVRLARPNVGQRSRLRKLLNELESERVYKDAPPRSQ